MGTLDDPESGLAVIGIAMAVWVAFLIGFVAGGIGGFAAMCIVGMSRPR